MSQFDFTHEEMDGGYSTLCHRPLSLHGRPRRPNGAGYIVVGRLVNGTLKARHAHILRYEQINGPAPAVLDHLCRNRWCCNPAHLDAVSHTENVRRGAATKLDVEKVKSLRRRRAEGASLSALAREFDISVSQTHRIVRQERWV